MNERIALVTVTLSLSLISTVAWSTPSGREIMTRNEESERNDDITAAAVLTTGGGGSPDRSKEFTWWRKLRGDKIHYNTLTRFHSPAEVRGEGILFLEWSSDANEVLIYLPTFKKIRRVETQQQSGSFMGSELSYSDITAPHPQDYAQTVAATEDCPGSEAPPVKCFAVESIPATAAVRERTGYSRTVTWVREDNFVAVKAEYYGLDGKLFKRMIASNLSEVDPHRHKWLALRIRIENTLNGRFTLLQFNHPQVNQGIPDAMFTQQSLSQAD
jgi:hypothetical protein